MAINREKGEGGREKREKDREGLDERGCGWDEERWGSGFRGGRMIEDTR